jgi:hypothetical protein
MQLYDCVQEGALNTNDDVITGIKTTNGMAVTQEKQG